MKEQSDWQEKITGEWYGIPSVFDMAGDYVGSNKVNRSSVSEKDRTTYYMTTNLRAQGPLNARFAAQNFAFGVIDSDQDRIYMGPDFYGSGKPYGSVVDAHYYSPGWSADLKTLVHILEDGKTQVYSSQLYEGPRLVAVFNGLYKMATDYETNPETKKWIDGFVEQEKLDGQQQHILPMKMCGHWEGTFQVFDENQQPLGQNQVKLDYKPIDLRRAEMSLSMEGVKNFRASYLRSREGQRHDVHGPDAYGNGFAYGRALYSTLHLRGEATQWHGRDFIIDDNYTISAVWKFETADRKPFLTYGTLKWHPADEILKAQY